MEPVARFTEPVLQFSSSFQPGQESTVFLHLPTTTTTTTPSPSAGRENQPHRVAADFYGGVTGRGNGKSYRTPLSPAWLNSPVGPAPLCPSSNISWSFSLSFYFSFFSSSTPPHPFLVSPCVGCTALRYGYFFFWQKEPHISWRPACWSERGERGPEMFVPTAFRSDCPQIEESGDQGQVHATQGWEWVVR